MARDQAESEVHSGLDFLEFPWVLFPHHTRGPPEPPEPEPSLATKPVLIPVAKLEAWCLTLEDPDRLKCYIQDLKAVAEAAPPEPGPPPK